MEDFQIPSREWNILENVFGLIGHYDERASWCNIYKTNKT